MLYKEIVNSDDTITFYFFIYRYGINSCVCTVQCTFQPQKIAVDLFVFC